MTNRRCLDHMVVVGIVVAAVVVVGIVAVVVVVVEVVAVVVVVEAVVVAAVDADADVVVVVVALPLPVSLRGCVGSSPGAPSTSLTSPARSAGRSRLRTIARVRRGVLKVGLR